MENQPWKHPEKKDMYQFTMKYFNCACCKCGSWSWSFCCFSFLYLCFSLTLSLSLFRALSRAWFTANFYLVIHISLFAFDSCLICVHTTNCGWIWYVCIHLCRTQEIVCKHTMQTQQKTKSFWMKKWNIKIESSKHIFFVVCDCYGTKKKTVFARTLNSDYSVGDKIHVSFPLCINFFSSLSLSLCVVLFRTRNISHSLYVYIYICIGIRICTHNRYITYI